MSQKIKIIGAGSPILDILVNVDDKFIEEIGGGKGGMALVDSKTQDALLEKAKRFGSPAKAIGGSAGNTVFGLSRLGAQTAFLGKIGVDEDGSFYKSEYAALGGYRSRFKTTTTAHTGRCLSLITPDSERTMRTDLGAACQLSPADIGDEDFREFYLMHAEGYLLYLPGVLEKLFRCARKNCQISLDLSSFDVVKNNAKILPELLREYVDIVFANEDEAREFCVARGVKFTPENAVEALNELCPVVAVKLGKEGAIVAREGEVKRVPAQLVKAVDTTGAGDLWQAGFLYGYGSGRSIEDCAKIGAILGSEVVQVVGASIPAARWPSILERVAAV